MDWKKQTFDLEHKFKQLDAYYASVAGQLVDKNRVLQAVDRVAHMALTDIMAATDLESAQTLASNAIAEMTRLLEVGVAPAAVTGAAVAGGDGGA